MLKFTENIDEEYFLPKKKKGKKRVGIFIGQKRPRTKPVSDIAKYVKMMNKQNIRDLGAVKDYLQGIYDKIPDELLRLYHALASSKVANGKIHLGDSLVNKPLYRYDLFVNQEAQTITNDDLVLNIIYARFLDSLEDKDLRVKWLENSTLSNVHIASPGYLYEGEVLKGCCQDFVKDFAAYGIETLPLDQKNLIFDKKNFIDIDDNKFTIGDTEYYVIGDCKACIICSKTIFENNNENILRNLYERAKIFHGGKKIELDEKKFKLNNKVRYIDLKLKPETFCPSFLILPKKIRTNILFKAVYNYDDLYNQLWELSKNGEFILPENLFYWTQMHDCMDFIGIFALTCPDLDPQLKEKLTEFYDLYIKCKYVLNIQSKNQIELRKIMQKFYNCFQTQIDYDSLVSLKDRIDNYLQLNRRLDAPQFNNDDLKEFYKILSDLGIGQMVIRQNDKDVESVVLSMQDCIEDLVKKDADDIAERLKNVCQMIYLLFNTGERKDPAFPYTLPPGAYLGNLGAIPIENMLQKNIAKMKGKFKQENKIKKEEINKIADILNNRAEFMVKLVSNSIDQYLEEFNIKLTKEERDQVETWTVNTINRNAKNSEDANRVLTEIMLRDKKIDKQATQAFDGIIESFVDEILAQKEDDEVNKQIDLMKEKNKIKKIKSRIKRMSLPSLSSIDEEKGLLSDQDDDEGPRKRKKKEGLMIKKDKGNIYMYSKEPSINIETKSTKSKSKKKRTDVEKSAIDSARILKKFYNLFTGKQSSVMNNGLDISYMAEGDDSPVVKWLKNLIAAYDLYKDIKYPADIEEREVGLIMERYNFPPEIIEIAIRKGIVPPLKDAIAKKDVLYNIDVHPYDNDYKAETRHKEMLKNKTGIPNDIGFDIALGMDELI